MCHGRNAAADCTAVLAMLPSLQSALDEEEQFAKVDPVETFPLESVINCVQRVRNLFALEATLILTQFDELKDLSKQKLHAIERPTDINALDELDEALGDACDELCDACGDLSKAQRKSARAKAKQRAGVPDDGKVLAAENTVRVAKAKQHAASKAVEREKSRLSKLSQEHFPELPLLFPTAVRPLARTLGSLCFSEERLRYVCEMGASKHNAFIPDAVPCKAQSAHTRS